MPSKEHLKTLQCGLETWNDWRLKNPKIKPDLSSANLNRHEFSGYDLSNVDFRFAELVESDLSNSNLSGSDLSGANLLRANLQGSILNQCQLMRTLFISTDLSKSKLISSYIVGAYFKGANLISTNFSKSDLRNAVFIGSNVSGAVFTESVFQRTTIGDVNLNECIGLESVFHYGPSSIGLESLFSFDKIFPLSFLKGCGVPDDTIEYVKSRKMKAIEFYNCFISYSSKDSEFAKLLQNELQKNGVRCWFDKKDLKIGDVIFDEIFKSIRLSNKLLIILSENSIGSDWVKDEVNTAIEEERQKKRNKLFPIRIDDFVWETNEPWAAKIRHKTYRRFC